MRLPFGHSHFGECCEKGKGTTLAQFSIIVLILRTTCLVGLRNQEVFEAAQYRKDGKNQLTDGQEFCDGWIYQILNDSTIVGSLSHVQLV